MTRKTGISTILCWENNESPTSSVYVGDCGYNIKPNKVKRKLQEGKTATVVGGLNNPETIDFLGQFGFDGLWIETEHAPTTWEQLTNSTRACDLWGVTSVCRVTTNDTSLITRTLDSGCTGIAVPHVNTKAEAEKAAKSAKYSPLGYRGMGAGRQSYGEADYYRTANEETLVIAFIEEVEAVENLDEILTVDNIDVFFMAPSDLAASMGVPWNPWSAEPEPREVTETVDRCIRKIVDAGRTAGFLAREETLQSVYDKGVRFFLTNWGPWVAKGARSYLDQVNRIEG